MSLYTILEKEKKDPNSGMSEGGLSVVEKHVGLIVCFVCCFFKTTLLL